MKNVMFLLLMALGINVFSQVAINTDGTAADNSAMLDVKSTTRGLLAPRMTMAQRNAIVTPATGLIVFQTNGTAGYYYNSGTPAAPVWSMVGSNAGQWLNNGTSIYYNLGNVGIGTSDPIEKLHVEGDMTVNDYFPFITLNGNSATQNMGLRFTSEGLSKGWLYYNDILGSMILNADIEQSGWRSDLVIRNDGNVGIGDIAPSARFHVFEDSPGFTAAFGAPISPWTAGTNVAVGNDDEDAVLYVGQASGREGFLIWQYNADPALGYYSIGTYNGSNHLTLQEYGGNVGIRTVTPDALFHVAEAGPGYTGLFGTPISGYTTGTNVSVGDDNANAIVYVGQGASNKGFLIWHYNATPANAYFSLGTYSGNNAMILQEAGGKVGIGTTAPTSLLDVHYDANAYNLLGYTNAYTNYFYHSELDSDGDGQAAIYGFRTRSAASDGSGYGAHNSNSAIKGYSFWGDQYSFGTSGFNYNDFARSGGVLGANQGAAFWGALGYKNSGNITYGGYFTSYTSGAGKSAQANTGIGIGAWGDLIGADIHGKVYGIYAEGENYAMFSNGDVYKNKLDVHLQDNGTGANTVLYTNVSTDVTVQTSGVATLSNGRAGIAFDPSFAASVSIEAPVIVTVTPIGNSNGVYLAEVSGSGFTVVENNNGKSNVTVNYIAIGKRAGYEHPNLPQEVIEVGYTNKMAKGLHNDADTETNGQGLYYENGELVVGIHPSAMPDPYKPAIETIIPKPSAPSNEGLGVNGISTGANDHGLIQPKAPVKELPAVETAGTGSGKPQPIPQASPKVENNRNESPSSVSSPPDRPVQNK
ncbi:MAG: hypothetical protein V1775_12925 [Bacteroidota bacterium]